MASAARIVSALGGRWYGSYGAVRCVAHEDHEPSLVIRDGDNPGTLLVRCYAGCEARQVLDELRRRGLIDGESRPSESAAPRQSKREDVERELERRIRAARKVADETRGLGGTLGQAYLDGRGLTGPYSPVLRFHPSSLHTPSCARHPAMVAFVAGPDGRFAGVHRTYLAPDPPRKAGVEPVKMSLGPISRGAVRLGDAHGDIAVGEGIETCLSFMQAERIPTWAALSTSGMRSIVLPMLPIANKVILIVDADAAGEAAARAAAERFAAEGRSVKLARPLAGKDMNDSLRAL